MRVYLDVSCLNRPFDDQSQTGIHRESESVLEILENVERGLWTHVSSDTAVLEVNQMEDEERRARVKRFLPPAELIIKISSPIITRSRELREIGFKPADALHVAAAEVNRADVLFTCDDRFCRLAKRHRRRLKVWYRTHGNGSKEKDKRPHRGRNP